MANIYENLDAIFDRQRSKNQGILDDYKKTAYSKAAAPDIGGILGNVVKGGIGAARGIMGDPTGWADVAGGIGGIADSAGRQKSVNYMTGEDIADKPQSGGSQFGQGLGTGIADLMKLMKEKEEKERLESIYKN